jgi:hypothetical protein
MKKFLSHMFLLVLLLSLISCEDYLNTIPKGKTVPSTVEELEWLLSDMQRMTGGTINTIYMGDEIYVSDLVYRTHNFSRPFLKGYAGYRTFYSANENDWDWSLLYKQIWTANYVLEKIDDAPLEGKTELERENIRGEALAARATAYFFLVNVYAKQYDPLSASTDPSIPVVTSTNLDQETHTATVEEVYSFIEEDLDDAESLLFESNPPTVYYHFSKAGLYGLRARIALFKYEWDKALEYATKAYAITNNLWDYNDYLSDYENYISGQDNITFPEVRDRLRGTELDNEEITLLRQNNWVYANRYIPDWVNYFADDFASLYTPDDLRFSFFAELDPGSGRYEYQMTSAALQGIGVPELVLTMAEVHARQQNTDEAMDLVNLLRVHRIDTASYVPLTAATAEEALEIVLLERSKEMMFTGLRWYDIRRLIFTGDYTQIIERTVDGQDVYITPELENYILEIPEDIENLNY